MVVRRLRCLYLHSILTQEARDFQGLPGANRNLRYFVHGWGVAVFHGIVFDSLDFIGTGRYVDRVFRRNQATEHLAFRTKLSMRKAQVEAGLFSLASVRRRFVLGAPAQQPRKVDDQRGRERFRRSQRRSAVRDVVPVPVVVPAPAPVVVARRGRCGCVTL